jgi:23S rRNA (cytosine1962-C5)-methyltransferase
MGDLTTTATLCCLLVIGCLVNTTESFSSVPSVARTIQSISYKRRPLKCLSAHQTPPPEDGVGGSNLGTDNALLDAVRKFSPSPIDAAHVFHGRGGLYPGCEHLTVDWYPPVWLVTSFQPVSSDDLDRWEAALKERCQEVNDMPLTWVYQDRSVSPTQTRLMSGEVPDPHVVQENGSSYAVQITEGRNHGLFLDMAKGREWVQEHANGKTVLNLFAYSCSFSVAALQGGATEVVNIDMSRGVLKMGQRNHELNKLGDARFFGHDIFKSWGKLKKLGPYELVVCDPPSYQKGSFVATKDYGKVIRRLPTLLAPGGYALLCLNAPELDCQFIQDQVAQEAPEMIFVERLENPETYPVAFPERALKVMLYRLPE